MNRGLGSMKCSVAPLFFCCALRKKHHQWMSQKESGNLLVDTLKQTLSWRIREGVTYKFSKLSKLSWMRVLEFFLLLLCLCLSRAALAQPSPYGAQNGNLGTWTWGQKQSPPEQDEAEEPEESQATEGDEKADDAAKTGEKTAQERGGTSWERLQAGRESAPAEEEPKTTTLLELWHTLREKLR
jgi:hypothetical protein